MHEARSSSPCDRTTATPAPTWSSTHVSPSSFRSNQTRQTPVSMAIPSVQLEFSADRHVTRWRPLVHWLMSVPHLMVANTLSSLQGS
jgi:hypothetical protein